MSAQHAGFLRRLDRSTDAVAIVASWLARGGKTVEVPGLSKAPTAAEAHNHFDSGDLFVIERKVIQVKCISREFTGPNDWPFSDYIVSNHAAVDRLGDSVSAYVTVNASMTHAAILPASSRDHWLVVERKAKNTGNVERFYVSPLEHVTFRQIREVPDA